MKFKMFWQKSIGEIFSKGGDDFHPNRPSGHVMEVTDFLSAYVPVPATETYLDFPLSWIHPLPAIQLLPALENWPQMAFSTREYLLIIMSVHQKEADAFNIS